LIPFVWLEQGVYLIGLDKFKVGVINNELHVEDKYRGKIQTFRLKEWLFNYEKKTHQDIKNKMLVKLKLYI